MKVRAVIYCTRKELYRLLKGKPQEYIDGDVNTICKNINNALLAKEDKFSFYADIFKEDNINYSERVKNLKPLSSFRDNESLTIILEIDLDERNTLVIPRNVFPVILYDLDEVELSSKIKSNRITDLLECKEMELSALLNTPIVERNVLGAISYADTELRS